MVDGKEKWLVAVTAGPWQVHGIRSAQAAGLKVLAFDGQVLAPGLEIADRSSVVDVYSPDQLVRAVKESGIVPAGAIAISSEAGMLGAGYLREAFDLLGPNVAVTRQLLEKDRQRQVLDDAGFSHSPLWRAADTPEQARSLMASLKFPVIVKPTDSAGSRGVTRVDDEADVVSAIGRAFASSRSRRIIMEEALPGTEYTVDTFTHAGQTHLLAVSSKAKLPSSKGVVATGVSTIDLQSERAQRIGAVVSAALRILGLQDGPGHSEVMVAPDGRIGLVESAGRGGGFMIYNHLVLASSGFDVVLATMLQAVGQAPPPVRICYRPSVLRWIPTVRGVVRRLDGFDAANRLPGVLAMPFVSVGYHAASPSCDGDRLAGILTTAQTTEDADALADEVQSLLDIEVEPIS